MTETKPIELNIEGLNEAASKMVIAISNECKCSIEEAVIILANRIAKEAA